MFTGIVEELGSVVALDRPVGDGVSGDMTGTAPDAVLTVAGPLARRTPGRATR